MVLIGSGHNIFTSRRTAFSHDFLMKGSRISLPFSHRLCPDVELRCRLRMGSLDHSRTSREEATKQPPMIPMKKSKLIVSEYFVFGETPAWLKIFHI